MMKRCLLSALLLTASLAVGAENVEIEVSGLRYSCNTDTKEATVLGPVGNVYDPDVNLSVTAVDIRASVTHGGQTYSVTTIGKQAFYSWDYVGEVTIPEGITTIEDMAFLSMYRLTTIELPSTITKIGREAFDSDQALISVISHIENPAAVDCHDYAFILDYESVPSDVDPSGYVYTGFTPYQAELYVPAGSKSAYEGASWANGHFSKIIEGTPLTATVGGLKYMYYEDSRSAKVVNGGYESLSTVDIPSKVAIGGKEYAVTSIENLAFDGCNLSSVTLHEGLLHIGAFAFRDNINLKDFAYPSTLKEIRKGAFWGCAGLKHVVLNEGLATLATFVYNGCSSLETVELPSTLTSVQYGAFMENNALKTIISFVPVPFSLTETDIVGTYGNEDPYPYIASDATLKVPGGTMAAYETQGWSRQFKSVEEYVKTTPALSFPKSEYTFDLDHGTFTEPTLTNPQGVSVTYTSSNPAVVKVEAATGSVTILATGEAMITATFAGSPKYLAASASYKLKATATPITVTADNLEMTYGDNVPALTFTVTGGTISGTPAISCTATKTSNAGTYTITVAKGTVTNAAVTFKAGTLTVKKAPLTIKAANSTKKVGEDNPAFTVSYEGFKNGETAKVLTTAPKVACTATKESPTGEYTITASGAEAQNYAISYVSGKLTVTSWTPGDVNHSGTVDKTDVSLLVDYLMGKNPSGFYKDAANVNNDTKINIADIVAILKTL